MRFHTFALAAIATITTGVSAEAVIIDGRFSADDNYDSAFVLDASNGEEGLTGGVLRIGRDATTNDWAVHITVPTSYVDNKYGAPADDPASGWEKGHKFKELEGSDNLKFTLSSGGQEEDIEFDYITKDFGSETKKGEEFVTSLATSLQWNLANVPGANTENSLDPFTTLWQDALQYEFTLDPAFIGGALTLANFSDFSIHASPSKSGGTIVTPCVDRNDCFPTTSSSGGGSSSSGGGQVPAPGGLAFILPLLGFAALRSRRNRKN